MDSELFFVGFYSPSEPGMCQRWRPKMNSPENVRLKKALKRFNRLVDRMKAGKKVDGLLVASVALFTEKGDAIRSMTFDGTEAQATPEDAIALLQTTVIRGQA